jgi:glycosyltransferase involved in cell wall biosynthesis
MRLTCVTVCVDYADFLGITLPRNKGFFDDYVVVTTAADSETQELCRREEIRCILTDRLHHNGARFNKGCALNDGFAQLEGPEWVVVLDGDTILPAGARKEMDAHVEDPRVLYSAHRRVSPTAALWLRHMADPDRVPLIETHDDRRGYIQLGPGGTGYFVVFHSQAPTLSEHVPWCREEFPDASEVDVDFARRWGRYRAWLPFQVVHLGATRANWGGRVTPRFA